MGDIKAFKIQDDEFLYHLIDVPTREFMSMLNDILQVNEDLVLEKFTIPVTFVSNPEVENLYQYDTLKATDMEVIYVV